jgi:hypothetical protein
MTGTGKFAMTKKKKKITIYLTNTNLKNSGIGTWASNTLIYQEINV